MEHLIRLIVGFGRMFLCLLALIGLALVMISLLGPVIFANLFHNNNYFLWYIPYLFVFAYYFGDESHQSTEEDTAYKKQADKIGCCSINSRD